MTSRQYVNIVSLLGVIAGLIFVGNIWLAVIFLAVS